MNSCHFAGKQAFRVILIVLSLLGGVLLLAGCGGAGTGAASKASDQIPVVLDQQEYLLYQNIFYNGYGNQYDGKTVTKQGVFAVLKDAFNKRDRYYVWGYLDQTKCCDWQWEFVPENPDTLPPVGSKISVEGTFVSNEDALDGYWIDSAKVKTLTEFTGKAVALNMRAMSDTLERVQVINIVRIPKHRVYGIRTHRVGRCPAGSLLRRFLADSLHFRCRDAGHRHARHSGRTHR